MLKYLIIPLADNAVSFCNYSNSCRSTALISSQTLSRAITWAMKENLCVQFLYPEAQIPEELDTIIKGVDHADIVPITAESSMLLKRAVVIVTENFDAKFFESSKLYVVRTTLADFLSNEKKVRQIIRKVSRLNIVFTDIAEQNRQNIDAYGVILEKLIDNVAIEYEKGHNVQLNIISDRIMLTKMNNCNAGIENITLAPNGKFYLCPAFISEPDLSCGTLETGLTIINNQLLDVKNAPICKRCDAWQCKRCVWLNRKLTRELITPGWQQCVMAHYERNAGRKLLERLRKQSPNFMEEVDIPEIDYLDPFTKLEKV